MKTMNKYRLTQGFKLLGLFLVCTISIQAQDNPLSLSDAIQRTLGNNYGIIISKADSEIAGISNNWGTAGRYPSIGFDASSSNSYDIHSGDNGLTNRVTAGLGLNWKIFDGYKVQLTKDKLGQLEELAQGRLAVIIENAIEDVISQYYNVLFQKERLSVLVKLMELSEDRLEYVQTQKDLGSTVTYILLQTKNNALNDKAVVLNQEVLHRNAIRNLNYLMGEDPTAAWNINGDFTHESQDYALGDLLDKTLSNNKTLQNQFIQLKLEQTQSQLTKGDFMPSLSLSAGANNQFSSIKTGSADPFTGNNINTYGNLALSYDIYTGGNRKRAMEIARINEDIALTETEQMKHSITNLLMNEFDAYNVRKLMLEVSEESLEAAELNLSIAEDKLKSGVINSFNYRDIQMIYLNSALNRLSAIYNLIDSNTVLTRLTGGFVEE